MDIKIVKIHNQGGSEEEYVSLKVVNDCDTGEFILADTTYTSDGKISAKLRHTFWLPDEDVEAGDFIRIHTGIGKDRSASNTGGSTTHHFYWGLKKSVWNDDEDCAMLFHYDYRTSRGVK